jgi:hypothetical protein
MRGPVTVLVYRDTLYSSFMFVYRFYRMPGGQGTIAAGGDQIRVAVIGSDCPLACCRGDIVRGD